LKVLSNYIWYGSIENSGMKVSKLAPRMSNQLISWVSDYSFCSYFSWVIELSKSHPWICFIVLGLSTVACIFLDLIQNLTSIILSVIRKVLINKKTFVVILSILKSAIFSIYRVSVQACFVHSWKKKAKCIGNS